MLDRLRWQWETREPGWLSYWAGYWATIVGAAVAVGLVLAAVAMVLLGRCP